MTGILDRYGDLLLEVEQWFAASSRIAGDQVNCRDGCSSCCRGLFDITLLDALYLKRGIDQLADAQRTTLQAAARRRLEELMSRFPGFSPPWFLNTIAEQEWEEIMPEDDPTACLLLSPDGRCLVYTYRPMTCRLNGIPMIDTSGEELSDEWCSLNFISRDPREMNGLRYAFKELFAQELLLFRELTLRLLGNACNELDTVIPAAILFEPARDMDAVRRLMSNSH